MTASSTQTLICSLRILVNDIQSDDGIANMVIAEAADRMEEMETMIDGLSGTIDSQKQTHDALIKKLRKAEEQVRKLEEELSWISELANSESYNNGDSEETRLKKIKQVCDDILSPSRK